VGATQVIRVTSRSARVRVTATPDTTLHADGAELTPQPDGSVDVSSATDDISLRCPIGSTVTVSTASGSVSLAGELGIVRVMTASGRVEVDRAHELEVHTVTGRVGVGRCDGACRVTTRSARIEVASAGAVELASTSGRVWVGSTDRATVKSVSSRIDIGASERAVVRAQSVSGRITVTVAGASPVRLQLRTRSGSIRRGVPEGEGGADLDVTTTSGSIVLERG
jgi:DUF4097 and DUF4098 domain-containing protein YvlB